jgi:SAM-dependent methyltransferase
MTTARKSFSSSDRSWQLLARDGSRASWTWQQEPAGCRWRCQDALDEGIVVGLDDSARMLAIAARKLAPDRERITLVRHPAVPLPFAANSFDAVTCLEALEFFPSDRAALAEMVRVLRPGGALVTTRRCGWEGRMFLTRYRSEEALHLLLRELGLESVRSFLWEVNYDLVTARKPAS